MNPRTSMDPITSVNPRVWYIVLACFTTFILVSQFLLYYPTILHPIKSIKFKALHISHRGGAGEYLENTMAAFKHAAQLNTDMFELDCHLTKDGVVVVAHDDDLRRTTGRNLRLSQLNFAELPELLTSLPVEFEPDFNATGSDRRMVSLEEVFREFPDIPVNMDVKENNAYLIYKVQELLKRFDRTSTTVWGSESVETSYKLHQLNPSVPLICTKVTMIKIMTLYWLGLLPFLPIRETHYEVIMPSILLHFKFLNHQLTPSWWGPQYSQSWLGHVVIGALDSLLMSRSLFCHLQKRGMHVYLWVLNEEEDFARAMALGVDGIMTDFPTELRKYLDKHPVELSSERAC